ncbi:MAG: glycosyltransferase family 4 protein [Myxococcales bacterium]
MTHGANLSNIRRQSLAILWLQAYRKAMAEVLFVSKPVAPPWNDSSKNLARDIARHLQRYEPVLLGHRGQINPIGRGRIEAVYPASSHGGFSPRARSNAPVFRRLLLGRRLDVWHFFFAPNRRSSAAGRLATTLRRAPSVHTVCSMPPDDAPLRNLVFADLTVTLSRASYGRFRQQGVADDALRVIPPCVPFREPPTAAERTMHRQSLGLSEHAPIWIYPGDLEHGGGAELAVRGFAAWNRPDALLVMACRPKTRRAPREQARLTALAKAWGIEGRVLWLGQTLRIERWLAASDFVVMVNQSPYAKMDYPLVALEAMALGRAVLVGQGTPCAELAEDAGAWAVPIDPDALADTIERLSSDQERRQALERQAHDLAVSQFSPRKVAAQYELLYEEVRARHHW